MVDLRNSDYERITEVQAYSENITKPHFITRQSMYMISRD